VASSRRAPAAGGRPSGEAGLQTPRREARSQAGAALEATTREVLLGFVRVHILYHAARGSVYGLWLMEELAEHGYKLSAGTLYPILHSLESRGLLRRSDVLQDGKIRKYYAITGAGRRALVRIEQRLGELVGEVIGRRHDETANARSHAGRRSAGGRNHSF